MEHVYNYTVTYSIIVFIPLIYYLVISVFSSGNQHILVLCLSVLKGVREIDIV